MPDASDDGGDHVATRATHGEDGDSAGSADSVGSVGSVSSVRRTDSADSVASIDSTNSIDSIGSSDEGHQSATPTTPASKSPAVKPARPPDTHKLLKPPLTPKTAVSPPLARSVDRPAPRLDLTRGLNLHALGISTSPLGPLERRISFASNSEPGSGRGELERFRDYGPGDGDDNNAFDVSYTNSSSDFGLVEESEPDHDLGPGLDQDDEFEYSYNDVTGDFDASIAEDDKDVLIDRLQDVVRHVSSYTPSSPSHSTRTRSAVSSAQTSPLRDKVATPAGKTTLAATTPASRNLMAVTTPAKSMLRAGAVGDTPTPAKSMFRAGAVAATPTPNRPGPPFNTPDANVMNALHAHIDEMEAVLAAAMAAEAVANAAAAASPRNRHSQHSGRHYPWQRASERRLRPTSMSAPTNNLDGSRNRLDERISSSARSSPLKKRGSFLEEAPFLVRNQSAPQKVDMVAEAATMDKTLEMPKVAEMAEAESLLATSTTEKTGKTENPQKTEKTQKTEETEETEKPDDLTKDSMVVDAHVIGDCEALADDLSTVLASLMRRSQEGDAIQQALVAQLEAANKRNAELEAQVEQWQERAEAAEAAVAAAAIDAAEAAAAAAEAEAEAEADQTRQVDNDKDDEAVRVADEDDRLDEIDSELSFLKLQLRGIEVQCRSHIPKDADPELTESIANWKADWAALRGCVEDERRVHEQNSPKTHPSHDNNDKKTVTFDRSNSTF